MAATRGWVARAARVSRSWLSYGLRPMGMHPHRGPDPGEAPGRVDHLAGVPQAGGDVDDQGHPGLPGPVHHGVLIGQQFLQVQMGVGIGQTNRHKFRVASFS